MIGYLEGQTIISGQRLLILVGGVGYQVFVKNKLLSRIENNSPIKLHIYTHVKEDALQLYGFETEPELDLFELVLSVSGVGPKTALALIDNDVSAFIDAVQNAKVNFFTKVPRVGKKLAQKIIIDLRSKLGSLKELNLAPKSAQETELIMALESLGFDPQDAEEVSQQIDTSQISIQEAIKQAMKLLNQAKT